MQESTADSEYFCVAVDSNRDIPILVPLLRSAQEMFPSIFHPLDGPAQFQRNRGDHRLFGIEDGFWPESSPNVRGNQTDRLQVAIEKVGEHTASDMRRLR
jgi:hypothetical protein